ncbi:hypothetical protein [Streptomyces sp. NPDC051567]|uniref:hypothetical protein n=1 Tax=Streptomyces sp. NPDC051567 TaxID=3365660 RepID=UPI00378ED199
MDNEGTDRSLLSLRATLVFLLATLAGAGAGVLTTLAGEGTARGVLCGLAAAGLGVPFFDRLIAPGPAPDPGPGGNPAAGTGTGGGHG